MECPICLNIINNSCVGSCMHHYCYTCLIKWLKYGDSCPTCKIPIFDIKFDKEFDSINNPNPCIILAKQVTKKVEVMFNDKTPPGLIICKDTSSEIGIRIIKLNRNGTCYKRGLRSGDIILYINYIPCINIKQCIKLIKTAHEKKLNLICELKI